jgi:hypothetical protein
VCAALVVLFGIGVLAGRRYLVLPFLVTGAAGLVLDACYRVTLGRAGVKMTNQWTAGRYWYPIIDDSALRRRHRRDMFGLPLR